MKEIQIAVLVGSLRRDSYNKKLADAVIKLAPKEFIFKQLQIDDLPLYNQDNDAHQAPSVLGLKKEIRAADGLLFVTPEYNRSIPGVLKNALDNASRPYGESAWAGKPASIIGISPGQAGTCMSQQHLNNVLKYLDVHVLCQPEVYIQFKKEIFNSDGKIGTESQEFFQNWMNVFVEWIKKYLVS